jgi:magnesium-transporting ATPase (P-type)
MGNAAVIVTDKTGTITEGKMRIVPLIPADREREIIGKAALQSAAGCLYGKTREKDLPQRSHPFCAVMSAHFYAGYMGFGVATTQTFAFPPGSSDTSSGTRSGDTALSGGGIRRLLDFARKQARL